MAPAPAVRAAEPRHRIRYSRKVPSDRAFELAAEESDAHHRRNPGREQVVNMPVQSANVTEMTSDSRTVTTARTAHVAVDTRAKGNPAQRADLDPGRPGHANEQDVGAFARWDTQANIRSFVHPRPLRRSRRPTSGTSRIRGTPRRPIFASPDERRSPRSSHSTPR